MTSTNGIPPGSPAGYLKPGEWQVYCPMCTWGAPINAVGGYDKCESCGNRLRVGEVSPGGVPFDRPYDEVIPRLQQPAVTAIDGKWDQAAANIGTTVDVGRMVVCDDCGEDYTDSSASGGYIWHNRATCPKCADRIKKALPTQKLSRLMQHAKHCPADTSFADFVRGYGDGRRTITITVDKAKD